MDHPPHAEGVAGPALSPSPAPVSSVSPATASPEPALHEQQQQPQEARFLPQGGAPYAPYAPGANPVPAVYPAAYPANYPAGYPAGYPAAFGASQPAKYAGDYYSGYSSGYPYFGAGGAAAGVDDETVPKTLKQRLDVGDRHWRWKVGLRTLMCVLDVVAIAAIGWVATHSNGANYSWYYFDDAFLMLFALIPVSSFRHCSSESLASLRRD